MRTSRRSFCQTAAALPALGLYSRPDVSTARVHSSLDPWIEIRAENLRHNVREVHRRVAGRPILAVIKNNGYGLGVVNVAKLLEPVAAIAGFAVVKLHEAVTVREAGIRKPILLMGPCDEKNLAEAATRNIRPGHIFRLAGGVVARRHGRLVRLFCIRSHNAP